MNRGLIEAGVVILTLPQVSSGLPRFMNRGLIEATAGEAINPFVRKLPRFMNRGLIEAARGSREPVDLRLDFPDS